MRILTFDVEDWFHLLNFDKTREISSWYNFESRIRIGMDIIYDIIKQNNVSATFFVVGWIAEKYPSLVREISDKGFEVASHTYSHQLVYEKNKKFFFNDVERSIKILEDTCGTKISSFRAPGFSITEKNKWAFEILYELGIRNDSSIFPTNRSHGGFSSYGYSKPSIIEYKGSIIKEFPINTFTFLSKEFIFSGGGYFRLFPYFVIDKLTSKTDYVMTYFHPRDFDLNQPLIKGLPIIRRFKSYYGIRSSKEKLNKWLNNYSFIDLKTAEKNIDWEFMPRININ